MRVLIVDDEAIARQMLQRCLTTHGYEVVEARDGAEALALMQQQHYPLVISDWQMPNMTGLELCQAIRQKNFSGYTYCILLTANCESQDVVEGLGAGADDFITKPFNPAELIMRVRTGERIIGIETRDMTIFALAKLAESRDPETGAHLERVRTYSQIIAQHLAGTAKHADLVDDQYISLIYQTSPLHDIGKVAIPDCVLLKPGRLTDREFEIMQTHTLRGAETLESAIEQYPHAQFLHMARDIALSHHEKFNGTGYPHGLAGDDIPLSGRIVALADVYDALSSKRVYKDAFSHDVARGIILDESGSHFDPDIVEAFTQHEPQFIETRQRYAEEQTAAA